MKMQNPKILIDCSILTLTLFIAMPMIANAVGSMNFLSVILLIGFPLLCLICGILCGRENGLQLHYPALAAVAGLRPDRLYRGRGRVLYPALQLQPPEKRQAQIIRTTKIPPVREGFFARQNRRSCSLW